MDTCKACVIRRVKHRRRTNPKVQEYDRARASRPERRANAKKAGDRYQKSGKGAARTKLRRAILRGDVTMQPCYFCGAMENLHGHHHDYSKPLDVIWFCAKCHHRLHALERIGLAEFREAS